MSETPSPAAVLNAPWWQQFRKAIVLAAGFVVQFVPLILASTDKIPESVAVWAQTAVMAATALLAILVPNAPTPKQVEAVVAAVVPTASPGDQTKPFTTGL